MRPGSGDGDEDGVWESLCMAWRWKVLENCICIARTGFGAAIHVGMES